MRLLLLLHGVGVVLHSKVLVECSLNVNPFLVSLARGYLCEHEITFSCYFLGYRSIFIGLLVLFLHFRRLCLLLRKYGKIYNVTKELLTKNHNYLFYLKSTIKPSKDF